MQPRQTQNLSEAPSKYQSLIRIEESLEQNQWTFTRGCGCCTGQEIV